MGGAANCAPAITVLEKRTRNEKEKTHLRMRIPLRGCENLHQREEKVYTA
jgi:hypothetical protein